MPVPASTASDGTSGAIAVNASTSSSTVVEEVQVEEAKVKTAVVLRTTHWHHRKFASDTPQTERKIQTCRTCALPITSSQCTQFFGKRFFPHASSQLSVEEWIAQWKAKVITVKGAGTNSSQV